MFTWTNRQIMKKDCAEIAKIPVSMILISFRSKIECRPIAAGVIIFPIRTFLFIDSHETKEDFFKSQNNKSMLKF